MQAETREKRRLLKVLEQASEITGFDGAVSVMNQIASSGRQIDAGEVEMVAMRAREQRHTAQVAEPGRVDLSVYDQFTGVAS